MCAPTLERNPSSALYATEVSRNVPTSRGTNLLDMNRTSITRLPALTPVESSSARPRPLQTERKRPTTQKPLEDENRNIFDDRQD
mmetsp:Transcript_17447/g.33110  ORF Transcript_17447/g.33110 Transcript_17447/m.33110 type:complete len:85 (+) Transcript_17447:1148-1402(+)